MDVKMRRKFLIGSTTVVILILSSIPGQQAARKDILKMKENQSVDRKNSALEELVKKCFIDGQKFIVIAGEGVDEKLIGDLFRSEETTIVLIAISELLAEDPYSTALHDVRTYYEGDYFRFQWKSRGFLVSAHSPSNLKEILGKMEYSRWWKSTGYFLITEDTNDAADPISAAGCSNAYDFLSLAWAYNILDAVYLCQERDGNLSMYTFDPYGHDSAPSPWVKVREAKGRRGHPWSLFKWQKYNGIRNYTCSESEIFFDKKQSLNGYPILVNAVRAPPLLFFNDNETTGVAKFHGEDGWTMRTIWDTLNATLVKVPVAPGEATMGWIEANGTVRGDLVAVSSGKVDMTLNSHPIGRLRWKTTPAYPHTTLNDCFMTKDRGTMPWLVGLIYVCDKWTLICGSTVFFIAVMTFGFIDKRRFCPGFMNALRVFLSASYVLPSSVVQHRVIICCFLLLPLVSYSTYQGKVLSLIRNPSHYANIDTEKELVRNQIKLEGPKSLLNTFIPSELLPNYHVVNKLDDCVRDLYKNSEPLACVNLCFALMVKASRDKKLHLATDQNINFPNCYATRPEFPLIDRFDEILRRMIEAGLLEYYREKSFLEKTGKERFTNDDSDSDDGIAMTITLADFYYVFFGLGIGWSCAFVVFIFEVISGRSKKPDKIMITNPEGISPRLTAEHYQIIRRISRRVTWPDNF